MTTGGPTQGAARHGGKLARWNSHPGWAGALRVAIVLLPVVISLFFTLQMGRHLPAERLGVGRWTWIISVFVAANLLLFVLSRLSRRLMPLVVLMKLTLVFPDHAPSRTKAVLRRSNSKKMLRQLEEAKLRGDMSESVGHSDYLVQLLREINDHDRLTRGHSERVRAYAELLGEQLNLKPSEMDKLRWSALLHDVGKLGVPHEVLNKKGKPNDEEWKLLQAHPANARAYLEPLRDWLGDWVHSADQHHCRWDGKGYPKKLGGNDISYAGRLVAIADAYDVMTSTRSYKKPLSAELARQELTDCAGGQFDPVMVRAFLRVGLGELKTIASPVAWLANLTGAAQLPVPAVSVVSTTASVATTTAWTAAVSVIGFVAAGSVEPSEIEPLAFVPPPVVTETTATTEVTVTIPAAIETTTSTTAAAPTTTVPAATTTTTSTASTTSTTAVAPTSVAQTTTSTTAAAAPNRNAQTTVSTTTAVAPTTAAPTTITTAATTTTSTTAALPVTTTTVAPSTTSTTTTTAAPPPTTTIAVNNPPTGTADEVVVGEDETVLIAVLENDFDEESDPLSIVAFSTPANGVATVEGNQIRYTPAANFAGLDSLIYAVSDGINVAVAVEVDIEVTAVNDPPVIELVDGLLDEGAAIGDVIVFVTADDVDGDPVDVAITSGNVGEAFAINDVGHVVVARELDFETTPTYLLVVEASDGFTSTHYEITLNIDSVDEAPVAGDDVFTVVEDLVVAINVAMNDRDPEGSNLDWAVPAVSNAGGLLVEVGGVVTYTPPSNFVGSDSFTYSVSDVGGLVSNVATVDIVVGSVNDAPVASDDSVSVEPGSEVTTIDLRLNDEDVEGDPLVIIDVSNGAQGTVVDNGNGTVTYSHTGVDTVTDSFTYTVADPAGATSTATVAVTITPPEDNDGVIAANDVCPFHFDPKQIDTDGDGLGDICDTSPTVPSAGDLSTNGQSLGGSSETFGIGAADIDNDGDADVIFGNDGPNTVFLNDGNGAFTDSGQSLASNHTDAVALGDVDSDGHIDAIFANHDGPSRVFFNDGSGVFIDSGQELDAEDSADVDLGDFDGDGDLDLVFVNLDEANTVWLNDGAGVFVDSGQELDSSSTKGVAVGDVDGDGDLDLAFANYRDDNTLWLNNGLGEFTDSGQSLGSGRGSDVILADFDYTGDLNLVFAEDADDDFVWKNDGAGTYMDTGQVIGRGHSRSIAAGDVDGDGDVDIVFGDHVGNNSLWVNTGNVFADSGQRIGESDTEAVVLIDLDGDGDLDLVTGNHGESNMVWFNE